MSPTADRPVAGILLMLGFCVVAPLTDGLAKLLGAGLPLMMVVGARLSVQALLLTPLVLAQGGTLRMSRRVLGLMALRTLLQVSAVSVMFLSLRFLPLADAIAIAYVMPFITLLAGAALLGESVGWRRITACAVGFGGTLMVMQPALDEVGPVAALPLLVAVLFSAYLLLTRRVSRDLGALEMQSANGLIGIAVLGPLLVAGTLLGWGEMALALPDPRQALLLLGVGVLGSLAHLLITAALRLAPAATLAPMQYLEIPCAALIGLLMFGDFPDGLALAGVGVVVGAGVYIILRERRLSSAAPA